MSTDARKHTSIAAGEKPTRAGLAAAILSISDTVPVANATEANQIAAALIALGQNLATTPLTVRRADAPGMHTIETTKDGASWVPSSAVLHFATTTARDTWTTSYSAQLTANDECVINSTDLYTWTGTLWVPAGPTSPHFAFGRTTAFNFTSSLAVLTWDAAVVDGTLAGFTVSAGVFTCTIPGLYLINSEITAGATIIGNIQLQKNGTAVRINNQATSASGSQSFVVCDSIRLAVGDTIQIQIQATGTVAGVATATQTRITFDMLHS